MKNVGRAVLDQLVPNKSEKTKIEFCILTCGEPETFRLLEQLTEQINDVGQYISVYVDTTNEKVTDNFWGILMGYSDNPHVQVYERKFDSNFAEYRNTCKRGDTDFIVQLDADEEVASVFVESIQSVIDANPDIDLYFLPRENYVEDITEEYVQQMRWRVDSKGRINFPDYQGRVYRNASSIKWDGKVHERIEGAKNYARLDLEQVTLLHNKSFERQKRQNEFYDRI